MGRGLLERFSSLAFGQFYLKISLITRPSWADQEGFYVFAGCFAYVRHFHFAQYERRINDEFF
jgi:hypothetical protein